ncbi:MAG TPA: M56 family metallopeptidase [Candidatus Woesebacteria bacterium]|nr:M56 family metallopeptidase [Candidatus Woesebacteria bacterium]
MFLLGYLTTLVVLTQKMLESCFVNFLRLYSNQVNLPSLVTDFHPVINLFGLIIATYLWYRFAKAVISTIISVISYRNFVNSLITVNKGNISIIKNKQDLLFTAGLRNPKIWISENLLQLLNKSQYNAVISHEYSHVLNKDPFWKTLNEFLKVALPPVPKLKQIIDKFNVAIELVADEYAIQQTNTESLLTALLLLMKKAYTFNNPLLVGLNGSSERLEILTQKKRFNHFAVSTYSSAVLGFFAFTVVSLLSINLFNHCSNPANCLFLYTNERKKTVIQEESCNDLPMTHNQLFSPVQ